jgi:PBSX family phage terminase large subunit
MSQNRIELYDKQFDFVMHDSRRLAFVAGIGSGKSLAGAVRALRLSAQPGGIGIASAPTYTMLRDATIRTFLDVAGDLVIDFNKSEKRAVLRNGFEVLFRTADDPEHLRGPNVSWFWMDEAALCSEEAWKIGIGRLRQFGVSGPAWLTTTPKGRNWIWRRWVQDARDGAAMIKAHTAENPYLSQEFLADLMLDYSGNFAEQELKGEFVAFEGLVYEEFRRDVHVWDIGRDGPLPECKRYIAGVDWGYTNPAVIIVFGLDSDNRVYAVEEFYQRQTMLEAHLAAAVELDDRYGIETFYCDPSEPEHIRAFRDTGLSARGADNAILPGINAVKKRLTVRGDGKPRFYATMNTPNLIAEFESYQWAEHRGERTDKPMKEGDHAMDAMRYSMLALDSVRDATQSNYVRDQ